MIKDRVKTFEKNRAILRARLQGQGYYKALRAMTFAEQYHIHTRKDGITPEFSHQVSIVLHLSTLPQLTNPEETYTVAFLHDTIEDYPVTFQDIESNFGFHTATSVTNLTKHHKNIPRDPLELQSVQANDPIASIVKGADRVHNHQSMPKVFDKEKILNYIAETSTYILPMLKTARHNFPEQHLAYESLKYTLLSQIELIEAALEGTLANPDPDPNGTSTNN